MFYRVLVNKLSYGYACGILNVNSIFNIEAKPTKLDDFFSKLSSNNLILHVAVHVT